MKKITGLIAIVTMATMIYAQCDVEGNYRVTALDVQYYDIARQATEVAVDDVYGLGVHLVLQTINAGDLFYGTHSGPYNSAILDAIGVNLNVNFNEDCTASLAAGSFYPDVNEENCVSSVQVLPITDDMSFTSNQSASGQSPLPTTNLVGLPSISARAYQGGTYGGLSLDEALIFDYFPQGTVGYMNQVGPDFTPFTGDEWGPVTIPTQVNYPTGDVYPANTPLPGIHGGWITIGDVGVSQIGGGDSGVPLNETSPDGFAEWHAIDGPASGSGFGDFIGNDEDGYDGDLDRTFGLPVIPSATYFNDDGGTGACSVYGNLGGQAVAGDVTGPIHAGVVDACYASVIAGVAGQCEAAGGVANTVYGGCVEQATGDDFAAGCAYYGVTASVGQACVDAGGPDTIEESIALGLGGMTCWDIGASYDAACGGDCACAAGAAATSCEDSGGTSLCCLAGGIGAAASGGDCTAFASSFTNETLDGYAVALTGATCGQTADGFIAGCVAGVDVATDVYVMDPSGASSGYSNFVTAHGVLAQQGAAGCAYAGLTIEQCIGAGAFNPAWLTDDGGYNMDPTCLYDADPSDCSGRLSFHFTPTCIPEIEVRQVVIEFSELGGDGQCSYDGDSNVDGNLNVLDVVLTVNVILGNARTADATNIEINKFANEVTFDADGYIGAIQMTLVHGENFSIELTKDALVADYNTDGNKTTLIVVNPGTGNLFTATGTFTIDEVMASSDGNTYVNVEMNMPVAYTISDAYPNPFNPSTAIDIVLDTDANVSVKVFNIMGQLVDVITESNLNAGSHSVTWDASQIASGVYFINTEIGTDLNVQKIMLVK